MVDERIPWEDRFNEPTPQVLRKSLSADATAFFDRARSHLRHFKGVNESVAWYGQCWRWSIEYRRTAEGDPLAVLIPSPEDLQLAMPLDQLFITSLPLKRLKRAVRDGLELAQEPFDTHWGIWSIQHAGLLEELEDLLDRRFRQLTGATA